MRQIGNTYDGQKSASLSFTITGSLEVVALPTEAFRLSRHI